MRFDPFLFFANFFLNFHESKWIQELKKNDLIKARKLCNIFRFVDGLNSINDVGEFETNYCSIYSEELELDKENNDKILIKRFGFRHQNMELKVSSWPL